MDIQKEREAFEAWLKSLNENGRTTYFLGQESTVAWEAWQAAKAQAVPEPSINLTGHDIKYITNFMCYEDQDNLDTEVTIQKCKSGFEGAGLYAWVAEYPEEGGIKISANSQEQNQ